MGVYCRLLWTKNGQKLQSDQILNFYPSVPTLRNFEWHPGYF